MNSRAASASNSVETCFFSCCPTGQLRTTLQVGLWARGISEVWDQEVEWQGTELKRLSRMSGGSAGGETNGFAHLQKHYLMLSPGKLQNEN